MDIVALRERVVEIRAEAVDEEELGVASVLNSILALIDDRQPGEGMGSAMTEVLYFDGAIRELQIEKYPNLEPLVRFQYLGTIERILLRPKDYTSFMAAMFWVDAMTERGLAVPELIFPFPFGTRQDRVNKAAEADYLFTAKSIAKEINARNFPSVTILDAHSDVIAALVDRCVMVHSAEIIAWTLERGVDIWGPYEGIVAPDGGAEKRANEVAALFVTPVYHAWKRRNVATGEITGFGMENPDVANLLIVDDMCDGGGTFLGLSELLPAQTHLYVTHGMFSQGTQQLRDVFPRIFTTDSVVREENHPNIYIIPACQELLVKGSL